MLFGFFPSTGPIEVVILITSVVFYVWPSWRICAKAGFPGPLGLLAMIPGLNVVLLFVLAFVEWPAFRQVSKPSDKAAFHEGDDFM